MKRELVFTRKHRGEEYKFYTCIPEYKEVFELI
jgi:hypothetical protein